MLSLSTRITVYTLLLSTISTYAAIIKLESQDQLDKALSANAPVILKFEADWCDVCKNIAMPFQEVLQEPEFSNVTAIRVNIDKFPELVEKYGIEGIPTFKFFAPDGTYTGITMGVENLNTFKDALRNDLRTKFSQKPNTSPTQPQSDVMQGEPTNAEAPGFFAGIMHAIGAFFAKIINFIKGIFGY